MSKAEQRKGRDGERELSELLNEYGYQTRPAQTADSWPRHIAKDRPRSVGQIGRPHNLVSYAITGGKSWPSFLPVNTVQIISFEQIEKNQVYLV